MVILLSCPYLSHFWSNLDILGLILNAMGMCGYTPANLLFLVFLFIYDCTMLQVEFPI